MSYRVPGMGEIAALPWNGLRVASLFAGGGGSSTGYRMAGYRVVFASEFIDAAADTYAANAAPHTVVDRRDVRELSGVDLLSAAGLSVGELDVLDGSPPCASFSTAGARETGWGKVKSYSDSAQRTDDLFFEFARLIGEVQPRVFVAENVSGLVKGTAKGYFIEILQALRAQGYRVGAQLLDASWLGVPQARQRLILIGVRDDLDTEPVFPRPFAQPVPLVEALPLTHGTAVLVQRAFGGGAITAHSLDGPAPTVMAMGMGGVGHGQIAFGQLPGDGEQPGPVWRDGQPFCPETDQPLALNLYLGKGKHWKPPAGFVSRQVSIPELRAISSFPADYVLTGPYAKRWERLGRAVPPLMMKAIAETIQERVLSAG